ncbi:YybH family protein [Bythopirellula polymerisocia]|uniref:SnoaL-like domain protein n=1 Tax=Bythopirellula polymerisocia TaxID=2528003 RepID=A0A5C6CNU7_9BACT|nr:SgcJ/EcaC family oxidoreductase [Bythopirellula polymerisocia]TWU26058.1 SnoaL-like domain protein [Bythopirellula polymerisocia]
MKRSFFWLLALVLIGLPLPGFCWGQEEELKVEESEQASPDETAIRANAEAYVEAYNKRDAKAVAEMWSPEAVYMDPITGDGIVGLEEITAQFEEEFAATPDIKIEVTIDSIDFVSPNVAIETGRATVILPDEEPEVTAYSAVHVKRDGKWLIDRLSESEVPPPPPSNYEQLKELEWMIGSWVDGDEDSSIVTECKWTKNNNFMTRSFAVVVRDQIDLSGVQVIGWDAAAKSIRSWVFDSHGGFAEGTWTHEGDQWVIHSKGTLPTGEKSSSVNIVIPVDEDSFTWQSVSRQVGGQLLPNVEEVLIVRDQPGEDEYLEQNGSAE